MNMYRCINAEQVVGTTFVHLLKEDIRTITIEQLNNIEQLIDINIREKNNAVVYMSSNEILSIVEDYEEFFTLTHNKIELNYKLQEKIETQSSFKNQLIETLKEYFSLGIPKDIFSTVDNVLSEKFIEVI